jgi:NADPH:quinone reductase-like Zn-dependent oxidoreductase
MRAIVMRRHGGLDVLELEQVPDPVPGPGEALVRVRAVAVNRLDLWVRENVGHAYTVALPLIPGYDVAGEVVAVGPDTPTPDAAGVRPGDRVYVHYDYSCGRCKFCLEGDETLCASYGCMGVTHQGGYAEYVAVPVRNLFPLGPSTSVEAAAAVGSVYLTAYHMLFSRGKLHAGETVLVMAAGSGVGGAALRLARWAGATVFATAGSADKRERAVNEGAAKALDYTVAAWHEQLLDANGGLGADLIVDHTGSLYFREAVRALAPKGRMVFCGASSGAEVPLDLIDLFARQISLIGSSDGTRRELLEVLRLLEDGVIAPRIDAVMGLEQARAAQERLARREHYGRILLAPESR